MKIFQMNDCDWYAAEDAKQAITAMCENLGCDTVKQLRAEYGPISPAALDAEDMQRLQFMEEEEDGTVDASSLKISFQAKLDRMIANGDKFPCFFASTEY